MIPLPPFFFSGTWGAGGGGCSTYKTSQEERLLQSMKTQYSGNTMIFLKNGHKRENIILGSWHLKQN